MLGARAIGPGSGSALIGERAAAGGAASLTGAQPAIDSASATRIAVDPTAAARQGPYFALGDRNLSSMAGIDAPARVVLPADYRLRAGQETAPAAAGHSTWLSRAISARRSSTGR